jgi:hypothetical protein
MSSLAIAGIVFACVFAGTLLGMFLRAALPEKHLSSETAPPNATVLATLLICAMAVTSAIFLVLELDRPLDGMIRISSAPLRNALAQLGR